MTEWKNITPIGEGYVSVYSNGQRRPIVAIAEHKNGQYRGCVLNEAGLLEFAEARVQPVRTAAK